MLLSAPCLSVFQNLKIQRSVGRAKDGTTFPLSLKLKCGPHSEEAEGGQVAPAQGYAASVWAFSTISGLITLLPDGTIYGINHSFALMLFGYGKSELLGKVGPLWGSGCVPLWGAGLSLTPRACACPRHCASVSSRPACRLPRVHRGSRGSSLLITPH